MLNKSCDIDSWDFLKEDNNRDIIFNEITLDALIPLIYCIGSICFLIIIYIKNIKRQNQVYQPLLNNQQQNSSYGSFQSEILGDQEETKEDDDDFNSDTTLVSSDEPIDPTKITTKKFDILRLFFSSIMLMIFCLMAFIKWLKYIEKQNETYFIVTPLIEIGIWAYATFLAFVNLVSSKRNLYHIRGQLNILYYITFVTSFMSLYTIYSKFNSKLILEYSFGLSIFLVSSILTIISIFEPQIDSDYLFSRPNTKGRYLSPELKASIYDQFTFSWVNPLINKGYRETLNESDIYELPKFNRARNILKKFRLSRKKSFVVSLYRTFKRELYIQAAYALIWSTISAFGPPYYLREILTFVQEYPNNQNASLSTAYYYVFCLLLSTTIPSLCFQQSLYIGRQLCIKIQAVVIGEVYAKSLSRKDTTGATDDENSKNKTGKITNLMAVDARKVSEITSYVFYVYCYPIQIIITVALLFNLLGVSSLVGILAMIVTSPIPTYINQSFEKYQVRLMAATDKRLGFMNELLQAIRIIKFFAWESQFRDKVMKAREVELKEIYNRLLQWIYLGCLMSALPLIVMLSVFLTYTKILGYELTAPIAFTALALFNKLHHAFDEIPSTFIAFIQARVSIVRIEKFLAEPEVSSNNIENNQSSSLDGNILIGFKDATFQWPDGSDSEDTALDKPSLSLDPPPIQSPLNKFFLRDLNISFPVNKLSIVCGQTGCGKTSLLMALLGEMECLNGCVFLPKKIDDQSSGTIVGGAPSGIAYVAQTAWIQNATIRDNILFGLPYDEDRYSKVISICALNKDLEIFEFGDTTEVGEKGITLSGGQKQRIALARAVYSQAEIIIMDDCLSAVDAHTAKHLYENCIMGDFMKDRTRILVTHHVGLCIRNAGFVVIMKDGQIIEQGPADQILSNGSLGDISIEEEDEEGKSDDDKSSDEIKPINSANKSGISGDGKLVLEEAREKGSVKWLVYKSYLIATGGFVFWTFILFMFLMAQTLQVGQDWWIKEWTNAYSETSLLISNFTSQLSTTFGHFLIPFQQYHYSTNFIMPFEYFSSPLLSATNGATTTGIMYASKESEYETVTKDVDVNYYLGIYILIGVAAALLASVRSYFLFMGSLSASKKFHSALLDRILSAKIRFFDTTPTGRILNRFSKDMEAVDQDLSPILMFLLYSCVATASVIFAISTVMPQFLLAGVFIAILFVIISAYYIATSRDIKRIESVTRSPIFATFGETIVGVTTIRAFGAQYRLMNKILTLVDDNNRPFLYNWACNRWLHTRVDLAGGLVSFATGLIILYRLTKGMDSGLAGFALVYSLSFTENIIWVIRMYASQEINMNSVERIQEYLLLEEEPPKIIETNRPPTGWPTRGEIYVNNLVIKYSPDSPDVLKDVSFHIKPTEKIGIVGRTGSGKSTLAISFFRFMEFTSGQIIIDGVDISTIGLHDLRNNITIIPQDPVLFSGTLRSNLDPFGEHDDLSLLNALRRAHLIDEESVTTPLPKNDSMKIIEDNSVEDSSKDTDPLLTNSNSLAQSATTFSLSLDSPVSENGGNFSQGQRQLIALARALVRSSKLIIMDEATASVDFNTDHMIQQTIRQEFKDFTLLCIAHRIKTVVDYDKILVLDAGKLVEFDHPYTLIQADNSVFRTMCEKSGEYTELLNIAKTKYEKDHKN